MAAPKPVALPGAPVRRSKPYLWVTWLAKQLDDDGTRCRWAGWFMAHYKHFKVENDAEALQEWNRDHADLMKRRAAALRADGWKVFTEDDNAFTVEGKTADVAGKPDIVAVKGDVVRVIDGKTGRERLSDLWQVLIYLWGMPRGGSPVPLTGKRVDAEVEYKQGGKVKPVPGTDLDDDRIDEIVTMIRTLSGDAEPDRNPSRYECQRCNISGKDCPARYSSRPRVGATTAAGF